MKILFGVQGTGNGHISRSRELVRKLKSDGHDVDVIISWERGKREIGKDLLGEGRKNVRKLPFQWKLDY